MVYNTTWIQERTLTFDRGNYHRIVKDALESEILKSTRNDDIRVNFESLRPLKTAQRTRQHRT